MTDQAVRGYVRRRCWSRVTHGVHRPGLTAPTLTEELAAWSLVLPEQAVFTGLTSAQLRGWWLPPLPADLPRFAALAETDRRVRRPGLLLSRHPRPIAFERIEGVQVASGAESLLACSTHLGLLDLTVLVDAARHLGDCSTEQVQAVALPRRRGVPLLRRALALSDDRSESPWESMLRILHLVCGIDVVPQHVLLDEHGGFVARGDLHLVGTRTIHEYDGAVHRQRDQHRKDLARERRIGHEMWTRRGYTDREVVTQGLTILRDADGSLGRPHEPERIRAWHDLLAESLFTPLGTARLRARLRLDP